MGMQNKKSKAVFQSPKPQKKSKPSSSPQNHKKTLITIQTSVIRVFLLKAIITNHQVLIQFFSYYQS